MHTKSHKQCNYCGIWFHGANSQRSYLRHLKTYQPAKEKCAHVCQLCEKSFPFKSLLNRHVKRAHNTALEERVDLEFEDDLLKIQKEEPQNSDPQSKKSRRKQKIESRI